MPAARTPRTPDRRSEDEHIERLYAEYADRLLAYCVSHLGSRPEGEDALQLTFVCALRALRRGVVPHSEGAWLYSIARNACRWQMRSATRRPKIGDTSLDALAASDVDEDTELLADLRSALEALPERQRRALLLREWQGLSAPEIARKLRLTTPATHALLTRARRSVALALTASRHAAVVLLGLVISVRAWLKGALSGAAAQTAATAVAVVGVGTTVIAAERTLSGEEPARAPAVQRIDGVATPVSAVSGPGISPGGRSRPSSRGDRSVTTTHGEQWTTRSLRGFAPTPADGSETTVPRDDGSGGTPPAPGGEPSRGADSSPLPDDPPKLLELEPTDAVPDLDPILDPLLDPLVDDATDDLPPLEVPEVPPLPEVQLPPVEVPLPPAVPPLPPLP